jgi:hypothetical protein
VLSIDCAIADGTVLAWCGSRIHVENVSSLAQFGSLRSTAFAMVRRVTTPRKTRRGGRRRRSPAAPTAAPAAVVPVEAVVETPAETPLDTFIEEPVVVAPEPPPAETEPVATSVPEPAFAARVPPPEPDRPRPSVRRAIFFDVENSSRVDHVERVLGFLDVDRISRVTDLVAVGNWRVINHETARMLAQRGAHLVHSAPSAGVRDWSDLRIAVAAGVWLAGARPGDAVEIISDDQAFDAVGDVATSLGVDFRRLSYRALTGAPAEPPREEPAREPRSRRRRRGGRRGRREAPAVPLAAVAEVPASPNGAEPEGEGHTAPHDELLAVARELLEGSQERAISIDALSNALKARGFRRPPGSPRLITRLRRIRELDVSRSGTIRLVGPVSGPGDAAAEPVSAGVEPAQEPAPDEAGAPASVPRPRRRRRRGGRRRRGRGGGQTAVASP